MAYKFSEDSTIVYATIEDVSEEVLTMVRSFSKDLKLDFNLHMQEVSKRVDAVSDPFLKEKIAYLGFIMPLCSLLEIVFEKSPPIVLESFLITYFTNMNKKELDCLNRALEKTSHILYMNMPDQKKEDAH